jgi:hypothetical protein
MKSAERFVISCSARTGSTMLVHLLRSRGDLLVHGEVFLKSGVGALQGNHRRRMVESPEYSDYLNAVMIQEPKVFIKQVLFDAGTALAVGFKFKTDESSDPFWKRQFDVVLEDKEIVILNLRRRNLLAQFASYFAVNELGMPTMIKNTLERPSLKEFVIQESDLQVFCESVLSRERASSLHFKNHKVVELWYEDIIDATHESLVTLQKSLGLTPKPLNYETVQNIPDLKSVVSNYQEINEWYLSTEYFMREK